MDDVHTVAIQYHEGGAVFFFSPAVAAYLVASLFAPLVLFLAAFLVSWLRTVLVGRVR